ncbi:MAG: hypothetical protein ACOYL6_02030 [Bacteriovoracaceae bacterium]
MKNKYFGEFLIEKKIIQSSVLIKALISQMEALPSIPRIVIDETLLNEEQVLKAFRYQQDNHCEFLKACDSLGMWSSDLQKKLEMKLQSKRKPLGEVLLDLNCIDIHNLTKALDEFLSTAEIEKPMQEQVKATINEPTSSKSDEEFIEFQPALIMELEEIFDDRKKKVIKTALVLIKDNTQTDPTSAIKLYQDVLKILKSVSGLCLILGLDRIGSLVVAIEMQIVDRIAKSGEGNCYNENVETNIILNEAIELAWEFRGSIISTCSEKSFMDEKGNQLLETLLKLKGGEG